MANNLDELEEDNFDEKPTKVPVRKQDQNKESQKKTNSTIGGTPKRTQANIDKDEENGDREEVTKRKSRTNIEAIRKVMNTIASPQKYWKPQQGENQIRILPSNSEDGLPYFASTLHHGFILDGRKRAFPCLGAFKKPCPVCKVIRHYESSGDGDIEKLIDTIKPKKGYLFNIVDRTDATGSIKVFNATPPVAREIVGLFTSDDYGDISDPEEGFDLILTKEGEGKSTRYKIRGRRKPSPLGIADWEENLLDLEEEAYIEIPNYATYCEYLQDNFGDTLPDIAKAVSLKVSKPKIGTIKDEDLNDEV